MATRKNSDGTRGAESERPGSYAKVSSTRRRKKGRRGRSMPPPELAAGESMGDDRIVDTEGEETEERVADDLAVDDLRRSSKPTSSRSPRRELGPLGMDDARTDDARVEPLEPLRGVPGEPLRGVPGEPLRGYVDPQPAADVFNAVTRVNVVELARPTSAAPAARLSLFEEDDEEDDDEPADDAELAERYALRDHVPEDDDDLPPIELQAAARRPSSALSLRSSHADEPARHSMSSVLGARASIRPSPPPEARRDPVSVLWWAMVALLTAIIAAAVTIAAREQLEPVQEAPVAAPAPRTPQPAPAAAVVAPSGPPEVSYGSTQYVPEAKPVRTEPATSVTAEPTKAARAVEPRPSHPARTAPRPAAPAERPSSEAARGDAFTASANERSLARANALPGDPAAQDQAPASSAPAQRGRPGPTPAAAGAPAEPQGLPINPY